MPRSAACAARRARAELVVFTLLCLWTPRLALAQQVEADAVVRAPHEVQPERPTVATHAGTVSPGWVEIELGGEHDLYQDGGKAVSFPANLKIGISQRAQLNVTAAGIRGTAASSSAHGLGDVTIGVKYRLLENAPIIRDFAILPSLKLPSASVARGLGTGTTDIGLLLISSRAVGLADVDINIGASRHFGGVSGSPTLSTLWTVSAGLPIAGPFGWTGELYGFPGTAGTGGSERIVAVLTGPTWQPVQWLAADVGVIEPIAGPQPRAFYAGFVWNVGKLP